MDSESNPQARTVVVIGGGITGLSAAYYLEQKAREQGVDVRPILLEADSRLGGKVQTETVDDFVIELGPDSFLVRKPAAVNLCRELGITGELVGTNPQARKTYILHQGKLHRIPQGLNIGIPTQFMPFATTGLLSWGGKLRAGLDLVIPRSKHLGDQSLGAFLERRLGSEVVDHIAEPLLAGIYAGDLRKLSLRATFPQFEQLEQKHGSLVRGMLAQAKEAKAAQPQQTPQQPELGAAPTMPNSVFVNFDTGLERLIRATRDALQTTDVRLNTKVERIEREADGRYRLRLSEGEEIVADSIVLTAATFQAAELLPESFTGRTHLQQVPHATVATVVLAFDQGVVNHPLDGSGFLVPKNEGRTITAATWTSSKWLHTAKNGKVLMRFYVGRAGDSAIVEQSDEEIVSRVRRDVADIMGVTAEPLFTRVTRWKRAMPQYTVGHLERVKAFEAQAAKELPGIFFAGAGYTGLGIPDCITQGIKSVDATLAYLQR